MSPRTTALAAQIHHDCQIHGWDRTSAQIAADLVARYPACREWGVTARHVARTAREKGWSNRLRGSGAPIIQGTLPMGMEQEFKALDGVHGLEEVAR